MIANLSVILICQLIGEGMVRLLGAPVPGPVIGMALLFAILILRDRFTRLARGPLREGAVEGTAKGMLAHLSLLFVPAGVGVVQHLDLVSAHGVAIFVILALSAIVTLVVTAAAFIGTSRLLDRWRGTSS